MSLGCPTQVYSGSTGQPPTERETEVPSVCSVAQSRFLDMKGHLTGKAGEALIFAYCFQVSWLHVQGQELVAGGGGSQVVTPCRRMLVPPGAASFPTCLFSPRPPSLDQLRADRLQREAAERARAEALLARVRGGAGAPKEQQPEEEADDRRRRYNSQFNPQLARRSHWQDPPLAH